MGGASGQGKLQTDGKVDWYEGGFKDGMYDGIGTILSNKEEMLHETGSGNQISVVNRQVQGSWKEGEPNGRFKFSCILREDVAWGILGDWTNKQKVPIHVEGNAYSWDELSRLENQFIQKVNGQNGDIKSSIAQARREEREEEDRKEKQEKESERMEREKEKLEKLTEKIKKCVIETNKELTKISITDPGLIYDGDCPCINFEDRGFFGSNLNVWQNKNEEWFYKLQGYWEQKSQPYVSKGDALKAVCERRIKKD